jgi:uncharacterized cupredoxin-like copper-binding protein
MLVTGLVISLVPASCAGTGNSPRPGDRSTVGVTERDFRISVPRRLSAGSYVFSVLNKGPVNHELIVIRTKDRRLPLRRDNITVDEEALERDTVGALEPGAPGARRKVSLHLTPGRYEFLCNMAGHYMGGMRRTVVVG